MDQEEYRKLCFKSAISSYCKSDNDRWICALWCSRVVRKSDKDNAVLINMTTRSLADGMNVSPDTVEDLAHSYWMFEELCKFDDGSFRLFVFGARKQPYIYLSHFRALYDAQNKYGLSTAKILDLLMTIVQAEGGISSRDIDNHARQRYGKETDWTWDASQVQKKLNKLIQRPDLPSDGRHKASELYNWIGENVK